MAPDDSEELTRQLATIGRHLRQVQIASSPTTAPHGRLGNVFHGGILFDSPSEFPWSSDVQSSTPSNMRILLGTELNQIRDMTHTPARGIDKELDMISLGRGLARSLPSCRSVITPISVLPPELLIRIFHFHALKEPPWSGGVQKLGWIGVTHVCRRWRQVALGDSSLWARITGSLLNAKWISEMLVRARNAPLLVVDFAVTPVPGILSKFAPHIFRIRELRLRGLSVHRPRALREICALEAPALEHFELGVLGPYPVTFHQLGGTTLFGGRTPKLRTLSLSNVSIPRSLIPCGQLTQLKITLFRDISTHSTPLPGDSSQLLDLLINSPDLEVLVLEFRSPTILFQAPDGQAIHFPRLSRLCLGGSTSCVANLLKVLQLPSSTTLHLRCIYEYPSTDNVNIILRLVSAHFHNPAPVELEFRSLRIAGDNGLNGLIAVAASTAHPTSVLHALGDDIDSDAELTISFDRLPLYRLPSFGHLTQQDILEGVFSMLPISNLKFLSISIPAFVPSVKWFELSQRCKKVTTIRASGRGTSDLLTSLIPLDIRAYGRIIPFPELESLLLENLDFVNAMSRNGVLKLYNLFWMALEDRRCANTRLTLLRIDHCVITPDRAECLKKYAQELRWDGDEGTPTK